MVAHPGAQGKAGTGMSAFRLWSRRMSLPASGKVPLERTSRRQEGRPQVNRLIVLHLTSC